MIRNSDQLMRIAKEVGWFDVEPSEYMGEGNVRTRKAPSSKANIHKVGTRRKGIDGNMWKVKIIQNINVG